MTKRLYISGTLSSDMIDLLAGLHVVNRSELAENKNPLLEKFLAFLGGNFASDSGFAKSKDFDSSASDREQLSAVVERAGLDVANMIGRVLPTRSYFHRGWVESLLNLLSRNALQELQQTRVDAVVFFQSPHFPWDICLYHAAKQLEINVGIINPTPFDGFCTLSSSLFPSAEDVFRQADKVQLEKMRTEFRIATGTKSRLLEATNNANIRVLRRNMSLRAKAVWLYNLSSMLFGSLPDTSLRHYSQATRWEWFGSHLGHTLRVAQLKARYEKLCSELPSSRFVYLPLHYQPERTTHPEGGIWANQELLVRTIRAALPEEVGLVVKEHPMQLANWPPNIRTRHYRSSVFYESIASIRGVSLISCDASQDKVRAGADYVCTVQGTSALEFLKVGKPAVTMKWTWLDGCNGYVYPRNGHVTNAIEEAVKLQDFDLKKSWDSFRLEAPDHLFNVPTNGTELAGMGGDKAQIASNFGDLIDVIVSS